MQNFFDVDHATLGQHVLIKIIIIIIIIDETKKMALNSQTVRAKINPPPVEPQWADPRQTPDSDLPMKIFFQGRHCVWRLTHRGLYAFLITKWRFPLFSMANENKIASLKCRVELKFQFLWLLIMTLSN